MFTFNSIVVLVASLQVISSQGPPNIPPQCMGPPPGLKENFVECCKVPPMFELEVMQECGFKKPEERPAGPPDCSVPMCVFDKYKLTKDGAIDQEAVGNYMDEYIKNNDQFKDTATVAKEKCLGKELQGPPQFCEAFRLIFCISGTMFGECSAWEKTDGCQAVKAHVEQCKPYFRQ